MQFGFYYDQTRCVGCYTCSVACKDWHDIPAGRANWMKVTCLEEGIFPHVFVSCLTRPCYHCEDAPCVESCPVDSITKREEDGIVVVDQDACLGEADCGVCREACPYGAPQFYDEENSRMQKCDLCLDRWQEGKKPICVEGCPLRALDAGPMNELIEKYGESRDAAGFRYDSSSRASVIMKGKVNPYRKTSPL